MHTTNVFMPVRGQAGLVQTFQPRRTYPAVSKKKEGRHPPTIGGSGGSLLRLPLDVDFPRFHVALSHSTLVEVVQASGVVKPLTAWLGEPR